MKTEADLSLEHDFLSIDSNDQQKKEVAVMTQNNTLESVSGELILASKTPEKKNNKKNYIVKDGVVKDEHEVKDLKSSVITTDSVNQLFSKFFKKPHRFIFAQVSLSTLQYDLIGLLLSRIHQDHWFSEGELRVGYSPTYQFSNCVLSDYLGYSRKHLFTVLKEPILNLKNKNIGLLDEKSKKVGFISLFKQVDYQNGILTLIPNDILASDWLVLAGGYAPVTNEIFTKLRKKHSKHLYELISRFKNKGKLRAQSLQDLYGQFGLLDENGNIKLKSYKLNKTFIQKCIKESIEDIIDKEKSIVFHTCPKTGSLGYTAIKRGKEIVAIEFLFSWIKPEEVLENGIATIDRREKREPYSDPIGVYSIIDNYEFEPNHPRNPDSSELAMMISRPEELIANGMELNADFMLKYSVAVVEANRKLIDK